MAPFQWNGANAKLPYSIILIIVYTSIVPNLSQKLDNFLFRYRNDSPPPLVMFNIPYLYHYGGNCFNYWRNGHDWPSSYHPTP